MNVTVTCPAAAANHRNHRLPVSDKSSLRDMLVCLGVEEDELSGVDPGITLPVWQVFQGSPLLREGDSASALYVVRSGSFKVAKVLEDGYEQVLSFSLPGELLGSVALYSGRQTSTLIALEDCTVYALGLAELRTLRRQCPVLDLALQRALSRQLARAAESAAMSAAVSSEVRLARFLLWLSTRMAESGQSSRRLLLRMGRRDIASLLCVAHETVCRAFTNLTDAGYLRVRRKEVELLDVPALHELSLFTRGSVAEPHSRAGRPLGQGRSPMPISWLPRVNAMPAPRGAAGPNQWRVQSPTQAPDATVAA